MAIRENLIQARSLYVGVSPNVAPAASNLIVDGSVGIGISNPQARLEVADNVYINGGNGQGLRMNGGMSIFRQSGSDLAFNTNNSESMRITSAGELAVGTSTALLSNSPSRGNITINGLYQSILTLGVGGVWKSYLYTDGNTTDLSSANYLVFGTNGGFERMRITAGGNVGIGTTTPAYKLDVIGAGKFGDYTLIGSGVPQGYYQDALNGAYRGTNGSGDKGFYFQTYDGINTSAFVGIEGTYAARIGIGNSAPATALHISKGDGSYTLYGPNASWGAYLWVGAGPNKISNGNAQVISTNGNLHLDSGTGQETYINSYSQTPTLINPQGGNVAVGTFDVNSYPYAAKFNVNGSISSSGGKIGFGVTDAFTLNGIDTAHYGMSSNVNLVQLSGYFGLVFATNGAERMRITDGGNLLVGTTTNLGADINANSSIRVGVAFGNEASIIFGDSGTAYWKVSRPASSGNLRIASYALNAVEIQPTTGNVGIGNSAPTAKLDVSGAVFASATGGFGNATYAIDQRNPIWRFGNADAYGISYFQGSTGVAADTIGFHFGTATAAASVLQVNQAGSVTVNGNVGIGTTSPNTKLDVNGDAYFRSDIRLGYNYSGPSTAIFKWQGGSSDSLGIFTWGDARNIQIGGSNTIFAAEGGSERMRITNAGNVGIGTTAPAAKLEVYGTGFTSGSVNFLARNGVGTKIIESFDDGFIRLNNTLNINQAIYINIGNSNVHYAQDAHIFSVVNDSYQRTDFVTIKGNLGKPAMGVGTMSPDNSAILDLTSRSKGFLPPRMNYSDMMAIPSPAAGLVVYDVTNNKLTVYAGSGWVPLH